MAKYVMNSKKGDHRVLAHQPGLDENTDYIPISDEDAHAVMAGTKTGGQVLREIFLKSRMEEINAPEAKPAPAAAEAPADAPPPAADEDPPLDFTNMTSIGLHTLKVGDLRKFAKERFDIKFAPAVGKDAMIAQLKEKMQEAK
jgi:hypothetical protein